MTKFLSAPVVSAVLLGALAAFLPDVVLAQFYNGPGIIGGITQAETIGGINGRGIREIILDLLLFVLFFMGLAAVVVIVIAGLYLIFSLGEETAKDKARKIILYAIIGLIVIALASAIVIFIIQATGSESIFGPVPILGGDAGGGTSGDIRTAILSILQGVLNFLALIAVIVIVIAGIMLVISFGDETTKDRVKRIILYTIIGLLLILLAGAIVRFIISATGATSGTISPPVPIPSAPAS